MTVFTGDFDLAGIKYFSFNIVLRQVCPVCGKEMNYDFNTAETMYPEIGKKSEVFFCCAGCDAEYSAKIEFLSAVVSVNYDPETLKPEG